MGHELIISETDNNNTKDFNLSQEDNYFDVKVKNKSYPSCYQYNILIMLAKRLIKTEQENQNACKNKSYFHKRFTKIN